MRKRSLHDWVDEYQDNVHLEADTHGCVAWVSECSDWEEAEQIGTWYEKAMSKRSSYLCSSLANHLFYHAVMYQPDPNDGSTLVGQMIEDIFIASHFAPATRRGGVEMLKTAAKAGTPFIFCVPDNLADQLVRLGFINTDISIPQWFGGEYMMKQVVVNSATTNEDLNKLAEKYV